MEEVRMRIRTIFQRSHNTRNEKLPRFSLTFNLTAEDNAFEISFNITGKSQIHKHLTNEAMRMSEYGAYTYDGTGR